MKNPKLYELKQWLKLHALQIKEGRRKFKEACRNRTKCDYSASGLNCMSWEYRHHHIAYCELRGRTREQIEQPREGNEPNESMIDSIKEQYELVELPSVA